MARKSYKLLAEYVILEKLKDEVEIIPATTQDVAQFVQKHYLHQFPTGTKRIYAVLHKQQDGSKPMVGCIIYGTPFHTVSKFLAPVGIKPNEVLELKRLFIDDIGLRNIESFVIGQTIKLLKKDMPEVRVVVTFADEKAGHVGSIYQATNAIYLGQSQDGKHRYIYIMNDSDKNIINQVIKPQAYPKKDVPPTEPVSETEGNKASWDLLAQIKKELEFDKQKSWADVDEPEITEPKPFSAPPVLRGANKRKVDKQSKLLKQPPLAETQLQKSQRECAEFEKIGPHVRPLQAYFGVVKRDEIRGGSNWVMENVVKKLVKKKNK